MSSEEFGDLIQDITDLMVGEDEGTINRVIDLSLGLVEEQITEYEYLQGISPYTDDPDQFLGVLAEHRVEVVDPGPVAVNDEMKDVLRAEVRESILTVGFRTTVERLMIGGLAEKDATQFVQEEHQAIGREMIW